MTRFRLIGLTATGVAVQRINEHGEDLGELVAMTLDEYRGFCAMNDDTVAPAVGSVWTHPTDPIRTVISVDRFVGDTRIQWEQLESSGLVRRSSWLKSWGEWAATARELKPIR